VALTLDQITAITRKKFMSVLVDNIFNNNALLKRFKATEDLQDGGTEVVQPLEYAVDSAAGWFQGSETLDTTDTETFTGATYQWKQYYANISITGRDRKKNSGDSAIVNFVAGKMKNAEKTLRRDLNTGLFNDGSNAKAIQGLRLAINTTGTYGDIAHGTYTWWNGNVDSTTTTLTLAAMQGSYGDASDGADNPTILTSDQDMFDRYWNLLQPAQRFADEEMTRGGFKSLMFNQAPYVVDQASPANHLFYVNEDYFSLKPHKDENMKLQEFQRVVNQDVEVARVLWFGVFAGSNNRRSSIMTAVTA